MYELRYNASKYFEPEELQGIIGDNNNILIAGKTGDSKCFFSDIIDSFLNELSYNIHKSNKKSITNYDPSNKKEVLKIVDDEIDKNNIINKLFLGYYETIYKCQNIYNINIYSFETEYCIKFDLENIQNFYQNKENITLSQCFEYYYGKKDFTEFYCNKCNMIENNYYYEKIYKPPLILVIVLNRGNDNNFDGIVIPDAILDLSNYIDDDYKNEYLYQLICLPMKYSACCLTDSGIYFDSQTVAMELRETQLNRDEPFLMFYRRNE